MTVNQKASKALSMASSLRRVVRPELKHYDEVNVLAPINTGSVISLLRGIAQGDTNNTLEGNQLFLKRINIKSKANINTAGPATDTTIRYAIVQDLRPQSSIPSYTEIWDIASTTSFLNIDTWPGRFKVLGTAYFHLTATDHPEANRNFNIPMNTLCKFNDTPTPVFNDILLTFISDEGTNLPQVYVNSRLRYFDN